MSQDRSISPTILTLSLAGLTGLLAYVGRDSSPKSERPSHEGMAPSSLVGNQTRPARLWQDPFSVSQEGSTNALTASDLRNQIAHWRADNYDLSVLGIFVEGEPYQENFEVRLRIRYAAQAAFLQSHFIPADRSHLGLLSIPWPRGFHLEAAKGGDDIPVPDRFAIKELKYLHLDKLLLPFEWFVSDGTQGKSKAVLILWLRE